MEIMSVATKDTIYLTPDNQLYNKTTNIGKEKGMSNTMKNRRLRKYLSRFHKKKVSSLKKVALSGKKS